MNLVAYYRVSTREQGDSGLGLEAQRASVAQYAKSVGGKLTGEYTEVESGRNNKRPQLSAALADAKNQRATLVVAKLCRLSRSASFTAALMDSGVDFVACDNPHATRLTIHILAAVNEDEARRTSQRTRDALAALKARGVTLGNPDAATAAVAARQVNVSKAADYAATIRPLAARKRERGYTLEQIAHYLTGKGILTRRGKAWSTVAVMRLLAS